MSRSFSRREFLTRVAAASAAATALPALLGASAAVSMVVYKDPSCGCCKKWVSLMQSAGFEVSARDTADMPSIKRRYQVPGALASCHTALVGGYVIEGHVPADLIARLLKEKPKVLGLAAPGMPAGSPGMEMGGQKDAYDVLTFDAAGKTTVFARR
jgi:hypothetical protein